MLALTVVPVGNWQNIWVPTLHLGLQQVTFVSPRTMQDTQSSVNSLKYPSFGRSTLGSATSALIPQMTVVPPMRTMALPLAVLMAPCLIEVGLNVCNDLPSGRTFSSMNRLKYSSGLILSKISKLKDGAIGSLFIL